MKSLCALFISLLLVLCSCSTTTEPSQDTAATPETSETIPEVWAAGAGVEDSNSPELPTVLSAWGIDSRGMQGLVPFPIPEDCYTYFWILDVVAPGEEYIILAAHSSLVGFYVWDLDSDDYATGTYVEDSEIPCMQCRLQLLHTNSDPSVPFQMIILVCTSEEVTPDNRCSVFWAR